MSRPVTNLPTDDPTLANRYLADQLTDEERAAFEERMLSDPDVLREVEATARFKVGLAQARERGELEPLLVPERGRARYVAVAAILAVIAIGTSLWRDRVPPPAPLLATSLQQLADRGARISAGSQFTLQRTRSDDEVDARIPLPAQRAAIRLRVLPDAGVAGSSHDVSLRRVADGEGDDRAAATIPDLRADDAGYIEFFIDSATLRPGVYRLEVDAATPDAGTFLIRFEDRMPER